MIKIFSVNTFAEAMLYYWGKANNRSAEKRLAELIKQSPEHKEVFEKTVRPVIDIEKKLNSALGADKELVNKYFKIFDGFQPATPFRLYLASIISFCVLINSLDASADEICDSLRNCSMDERLTYFCYALNELGEPFYFHYEDKIRELSHRLENSQFSYEVKWRIQNAAFDYRTHINELLSLIVPAVKIIEAEKDRINEYEAEFLKLYSGSGAWSVLESCFDSAMEPADIIKIVPMLFGFDNRAAVFTSRFPVSDTPDTIGNNETTGVYSCRMLLGIVRHLVSKSSKEETSLLCEKLKALADNTRLEILFYLCSHRVYGQELCNKFNLHHSTISHHITKLLTAGFVTAEPVGTQTYYTADKEGIQKLVDAFAEKIK